jgi:hypothetical protein
VRLLISISSSHNNPDIPAATSCVKIVGKKYTPLSIAVALLMAWKYRGRKKVVPYTAEIIREW